MQTKPPDASRPDAGRATMRRTRLLFDLLTNGTPSGPRAIERAVPSRCPGHGVRGKVLSVITNIELPCSSGFTSGSGTYGVRHLTIRLIRRVAPER